VAIQNKNIYKRNLLANFLLRKTINTAKTPNPPRIKPL